MVPMAGLDLPARSIRAQITSAIDLIVHLNRMGDGSRRVTAIAEVVGHDGDSIIIETRFAFDHERGELRPTEGGIDRPAGADVGANGAGNGNGGDPGPANALARAFPEAPSAEASG
jgi:hypothetical protein